MNDKRLTEDPRLKGDIAELKVIEWCLRNGHTPLTPFGGANRCRYDMAYDTGEKIIRVQVKCRSLYQDKLTIQIVKQQNGRPGMTLKYTEDEFDQLIVYCPDTNSLYEIPFELFGEQNQVAFRTTAPKNNQQSGVKMLDDYLLS